MIYHVLDSPEVAHVADPNDDELDQPNRRLTDQPAPSAPAHPAPLQRLVVGRPVRVSTDLPAGDDHAASGTPAICSDGRVVAFVSTQPGGVGQVHARDLSQKATILVSRSHRGGPGNGASSQPAVSADGRFVAFTSESTDLVELDPPPGMATQIYLCDLRTAEITMISRNPEGHPGEADSFSPSLSADGRFVAFTSLAQSFDAADDTPTPDVYLHDRLTGRSTLISVEADGTSAGGISGQPSVSAGGDRVAFATTAALDDRDTNEVSDIYVHDTEKDRPELVSRTTDGDAGSAPSHDPAISADGTAVAFSSHAYDLVPDDDNRAGDVFVHHLDRDRTELVSRTADGQAGNDDSHAPSVSGDGRRVAFVSEATDIAPLVDGAPADVDRAFVRDLDGAGTALVPSTSRREPGDGSSDGVAISSWGRHVAFTDSSTDLAGQEKDDAPATPQVHRATLRTTTIPTPPTDPD